MKPKIRLLMLPFGSRMALRLGFLPKTLRYAWARQSIGSIAAPPPELRVKLTESKDEFLAAFRLISDQGGYTLHSLLPSSHQIVALWNGSVAATVTVVRNSALGLPCQGADPSGRGQDRALAEVTGFALHPDFRGRATDLLVPLLKFTYEYATQSLRLSTLLARVPDDDSATLESIFFFEPVGSPNGFGAQSGTSLLRLDLARAEELFAIHYGGRGPGNFFSYFTRQKFRTLAIPERRFFMSDEQRMSPDLMAMLLRPEGKPSLLLDLSERERIILQGLFSENISKLLPAARFEGAGRPNSLRRRPRRHDVNCRAIVVQPERPTRGAQPVPSKRLWIQDVSRLGLRASLPKAADKLAMGELIRIRIAVSDFDIAEVEASPVWKDTRGTYGLKIVSGDSVWQAYLDYLDMPARELVSRNRA